jgi:hypothetical protein
MLQIQCQDGNVQLIARFARIHGEFCPMWGMWQRDQGLRTSTQAGSNSGFLLAIQTGQIVQSERNRGYWPLAQSLH